MNKAKMKLFNSLIVLISFVFLHTCALENSIGKNQSGNFENLANIAFSIEIDSNLANGHLEMNTYFIMLLDQNICIVNSVIDNEGLPIYIFESGNWQLLGTDSVYLETINFNFNLGGLTNLSDKLTFNSQPLEKFFTYSKLNPNDYKLTNDSLKSYWSEKQGVWESQKIGSELLRIEIKKEGLIYMQFRNYEKVEKLNYSFSSNESKRIPGLSTYQELVLFESGELFSFHFISDTNISNKSNSLILEYMNNENNRMVVNLSKR